MFGLATFLLEILAKGKDICYNNGGKKIFDRKLNQKGKTTKTVVLVVLVPKVGLEPTRYHYQRILSFLTYTEDSVFDRKTGKIGCFWGCLCPILGA